MFYLNIFSKVKQMCQIRSGRMTKNLEKITNNYQKYNFIIFLIFYLDL